ncbi:MAG: hypothetical protein HY519_02360, partial [Candidatus Aenigmarchaeota archaeon]|nr:hypothetical protein [Candidatus Aenigmarchaeota archaeon]
MIIRPGRHYVVEAFTNSDCFARPFGADNILHDLRHDDQWLQELISKAYEAGCSKVPKHINLLYYQAGKYTLVFLIEPIQDEIQPLIMQIARDSSDSALGQTVLRDHANLKYLQGSAVPMYTPKAIGEPQCIEVLGRPSIPIIFTEYLDGYHELMYGDDIGPDADYFYLNRPGSEARSFTASESRTVMRDIAATVSHIYAATFDANVGTGKLASNVSILAGDFVYRAAADFPEPRIKLVTVRNLEDASPRELMHALAAPISTFPWLMGTATAGYSLDTDQRSDVTLYAGILSGMRAGTGRFDHELFAAWRESFSSKTLNDIEGFFNGIATGQIATFNDISPGYRKLFQCFAERHYLNSMGGKWKDLDNAEGNPAFQALREPELIDLIVAEAGKNSKMFDKFGNLETET